MYGVDFLCQYLQLMHKYFFIICFPFIQNSVFSSFILFINLTVMMICSSVWNGSSMEAITKHTAKEKYSQSNMYISCTSVLSFKHFRRFYNDFIDLTFVHRNENVNANYSNSIRIL